MSHITQRPADNSYTTLIGFEDTFRFADTSSNSLIYKYHNLSAVRRHTDLSTRYLTIGPGAASISHAARYRNPVLQTSIRLSSGRARLHIAANGTSGYIVQIEANCIRLIKRHDLTFIASIPVGIGMKRPFAEISVGWSCDQNTVTIGIHGRDYQVSLPIGALTPGGFGFKAQTLSDRFDVQYIRVVWQTKKRCYDYDTYDTLYDPQTGAVAGVLPPAQLPSGWTSYYTASVDILNGYALLLCGQGDLNSDHIETQKGYCVRELATGQCMKLPNSVLQLHPIQGGGSIEGLCLLQSWLVPASQTWIDWHAFHKADLAGFAKAGHKAVRSANGYEGYHDPSLSLDGSLMRYLYITENQRGVTRFEPAPDLGNDAPCTRYEIPQLDNPNLSQTGPDRLNSQLAIRDRDLAWYEVWAYGSHHLHVQTRGYNLWTHRNDYLSPQASDKLDAPGHTAQLNLGVDISDVGRTIGSMATFNPKFETPGELIAHGQYVMRYQADTRRLVVGRKLPRSVWRTAQLLW